MRHFKLADKYMESVGHWIGLLSTVAAGLIPAVAAYYFMIGPVILKWGVIVIILLFTISASYSSYLVAPWLPTRSIDLERIEKIVNLQPKQTFYDLGCGDGKILTHLSRHSDALLIGIELSFFQYLLALIFKSLHGRKNVLIKLGNLFHHDFSAADVVYIYACPSRLEKIGEKLKKDLKTGAKIIAYEYPVKGLIPDSVDQPKPDDIPIYTYMIDDTHKNKN